MPTRDPTIPPSLKDTLDDDKEISVFREFQVSSTIEGVLPGYKVETEYDKSQSTWEAPSSKYLDELFSLERKSSPEKTDPSPSWDDVLKLIEDAEAKYKDQGDKNRFRRGLRQGQDVAAALNGLVELIPDESGLVVLRIGLSMAWSNRIKNREKVLNSLRDIPLIQAVQQMYGNAMDAIRTLIDILFYNSGGKSLTRRFVPHTKCFMPINHDEAKIDQVLEALNVSKANVDDFVGILDRRRDAETHLNTKSTAVRTIMMHKTVEDTKCLVTGVAAEISAGNDTIRTHQQETTTKLEDMEMRLHELGSIQAYHTKLLEGCASIPKKMEELGLTESIHTSLYRLSTEQIYKKSLSPPRHITSPVRQYRHEILAPEDFIKLLGIPILSPVEDRDTVLRKSHTISPQHLGRGRFLVIDPQFQHLLRSPSSTVLLVDGHCKEDCVGKVSPISVFCTSLAAIMAQHPAYMILTFFTSQHSLYDDAYDQARGPWGLVRSLICQILLYPNQPQWCMDWLEDGLLGAVAQDDIEALCYLFMGLVQRIVGVSTIFCIVDNISEFETREEGWADDLEIVFGTLYSVARKLGPGVSFKLLMTSAGKSTQLVSLTKPSEQSSLRAGNVLNAEKSGSAIAADIQKLVGRGDLDGQHSGN
ncbi:hypothetical protein VMCG_05722 [Cytospora schulzeri]|uniref:Uncharacterized protein n=1 Tax=Cytospora schulzeri TaxID=448051 RepID=A0A423WI31_9PEZI|nr:hypothetical protein VMCG_05722 [Valsa malicola]